MNIEVQIAERVAQINQILETYLPTPMEGGSLNTIYEAMHYSVFAGGKRIRPMLMRETYQMFGGCGDVIEPFMAAIEMIHTYSLVHDDLPAMDNDEYRRGKKTTHVVYGEAMGILTGDALLNCAFETALRAFDIEPDNPNIGDALRYLALFAGTSGMIGGQVLDIETEKMQASEVTIDRILHIYRLKTVALLEASMIVGAILAGAPNTDIAKLDEIAYKVGLAFQIQDDILDVTSSLEVLGKPIGSDEKNEKVTYVTLVGLEQAKADVAALSNEALEVLSTLPQKDEFLQELILYLIHREK